jgi:hypothetical protein
LLIITCKTTRDFGTPQPRLTIGTKGRLLASPMFLRAGMLLSVVPALGLATQIPLLQPFNDVTDLHNHESQELKSSTIFTAKDLVEVPTLGSGPVANPEGTLAFVFISQKSIDLDTYVQYSAYYCLYC